MFLILVFVVASSIPHDSPSFRRTTISAPPSSTTPNVGIWNDACSSANITSGNINCGALSPGNSIIVDINVTNAPAFNGYEFSLYYDPAYLALSGINHSVGTMFNDPFNQTDTSAPGIIRDATVNLASSNIDNGTRFGSGVLVFFTFNIKASGVSPLVLSAGTSQPGRAATDWTRLVYVNDQFIDVSTSDGYFQNGKLGPVAKFTFSTPPIHLGQSVVFNSNSSFDANPASTVRTFKWDFGDGSNLQTSAPVIGHIFAPSTGVPYFGNFSVRLQVVDDNGLLGMVTHLVGVLPTPIHSLSVTLRASPVKVKPGDNITVVATLADFGTFDEKFNLSITWAPPLTPLKNYTNIAISHVFGRNSAAFTNVLSTKGLSTGTYEIDALIIDPLLNDTSHVAAKTTFQVSESGTSTLPYILGGAVAVISAIAVIRYVPRRFRAPVED